jgi:gas vesicle protein
MGPCGGHRGPSKEELAKQRAAALAEAAAKKEAEAQARQTVAEQVEQIKASLKAIQEEARTATKELKCVFSPSLLWLSLFKNEGPIFQK